MMWCAVCGMDHVVEPTRLCASCLAIALASNEQEGANEDVVIVVLDEDEAPCDCPTCAMRSMFAQMYPDGCVWN